MTRIDFYLNAKSKLQLASRIVSKAFLQQMRIVIHAPEDNVARDLDKLLWMSPSTGFLPHCTESSRLAPDTPIVIVRTQDSHTNGQLLVNLGVEPPRFFSRFERLIEIVGDDEADKATARARFRHYKDMGYSLQHHDMSGRS